MMPIVDIKIRSNFAGKEEKIIPRLRGAPIVWVLDAIGIGGLMTGGTLTALGSTLAGAINFALSIGMTVYSMIRSSGGKDGNKNGVPNGLDNNAQLITGRQSSDPIRLVYGICKTGGTWVFAKTSSYSNNILNIIETWCEGEIEGIATAVDSSPIYGGSGGVNDLETGGQFVYAACSCDNACYNFSACSCNMTCDSYS
jgi:hypothetical protein